MESNSLEELLVRAAEAPELRSQLVSALRRSRVAIPLNKGLQDGELAPDAKPLTLNAPQGFPVLAVFTSPDKASPWLKQQPEFAHVLVTAFDWAVNITKPPFGIALNPGYKYSLALSPGEVAALAGGAGAAT